MFGDKEFKGYCQTSISMTPFLFKSKFLLNTRIQHKLLGGLDKQF